MLLNALDMQGGDKKRLNFLVSWNGLRDGFELNEEFRSKGSKFARA